MFFICHFLPSALWCIWEAWRARETPKLQRVSVKDLFVVCHKWQFLVSAGIGRLWNREEWQWNSYRLTPAKSPCSTNLGLWRWNWHPSLFSIAKPSLLHHQLLDSQCGQNAGLDFPEYTTFQKIVSISARLCMGLCFQDLIHHLNFLFYFVAWTVN